MIDVFPLMLSMLSRLNVRWATKFVPVEMLGILDALDLKSKKLRSLMRREMLELITTKQ